MSDLIPFSDSIWTVTHPLKVGGMQLGMRATIIRLPSDGLLLISPVPFDDATADAIDALGRVTTIVAPNLLHHMHFNDACRRWPEARALVPDGLHDKIELVEHAVEMGHRGSIEDTVHWVAVNGAPKLTEHVFVDPRDGVLIVTDIAFHFVNHPQWWLRFMMRLNGVYGTFGPSRIIRGLINDGEAFGDALTELLDYPWDAIIVAHGQCIEKSGRPVFKDAFSAYLPSRL